MPRPTCLVLRWSTELHTGLRGLNPSLLLQADQGDETDREDAVETTASGTLEEAGDDHGSGDDAAGAERPLYVL